MKKHLLFLLLIIIPCMVVSAQSRTNELGLSYSGYNIFGIRYKIGNEKNMFRLTLLNIGGHLGRQKDNADYRSHSQGIAFNVGMEKRNLVTDNIYFYHGPELMASLENFTSEDYRSESRSTSTDLSTGLGFVLGFGYSFSSNVSLSAEIIPSIFYSVRKNSNSSGASEVSKGFEYGINHNLNSYAKLTLAFRINPKNNKQPEQQNKP